MPGTSALTANLTLRVPHALRQRIAACAETEGRSVASVMLEAASAWLAEHAPEPHASAARAALRREHPPAE